MFNDKEEEAIANVIVGIMLLVLVSFFILAIW